MTARRSRAGGGWREVVLACALSLACTPSGEAQQPPSDAGSGADGAVGVDAPADGSGEVTVGDLLGASFEVVAEVKDEGYCAGACAPAVLHIEAASSSALAIVWGTPGRVERGVLVRDGAAWKAEPALLIGDIDYSYAMCRDETKLDAVFEFAKSATGDITMTAKGEYTTRHCEDDYWSYKGGDVTLKGTVDHGAKPPSVGVPTGGLSTLGLVFPEPLKPGATVSMKGTGLDTTVLSVTTDEGFVVGAGSKVVLPIGAEVEVSTAGFDLAGHPVPVVKTTPTADFGVLIQDGFESGSLVGLAWYQTPFNNPEVVETFQDQPAIAGQRMLHIPGGAPVVARLQRVGSETELVAKVRKYTKCATSGVGTFTLTVGVIGSDQLGVAVPFTGSTTPLPFGGSIGEVQAVTLALPAPGKDVLVALYGDGYYGSGCVYAGALLDDLRLQ